MSADNFLIGREAKEGTWTVYMAQMSGWDLKGYWTDDKIDQYLSKYADQLETGLASLQLVEVYISEYESTNVVEYGSSIIRRKQDDHLLTDFFQRLSDSATHIGRTLEMVGSVGPCGYFVLRKGGNRIRFSMSVGAHQQEGQNCVAVSLAEGATLEGHDEVAYNRVVIENCTPIMVLAILLRGELYSTSR